MRLLLVAAVFLGALALHAKGWRELPPTAAEATGAWRGLAGGAAGAGFEAGRAAAGVAGALASALLTLAFLRRDASRGGLLVAGAVAVLALLDPLGLAAGREAGPGAPLRLAGALATLLVLAPPRAAGARAGLAVLALALAAAAWPADPALVAALPPDPAVRAWAGLLGPAPGVVLLLLHHVGYALVPLALAGLDRRGGALLAVVATLAVVAACVVDGGAPARLVALAGISPPLLALAGLALGRVAERSAQTARTVAGVVLLVAAVNAPVFVSDLRSGQRFPWPPALKRLPAGAGPLHTTVPAPVRRDTPREVRRLPDDDAALEALLDAGGVTILLPVEGGRAWGAADDDLLARLERRRLPAFEVRVRRFDLYRFEVRAFILPPRR